MLNQCNFIGNVGRDPEVRMMSNGKKVASLSLAITEKWKDKSTGQFKENTEWIDLKAFDLLAQIFENFIKKGSKIFVTCKSKTESWDSPDGRRSKKVFIVNELEMLGVKEEKHIETESSYNENSDEEIEHPQDDLPF
jgi:single-strand DNA-binding protein